MSAEASQKKVFGLPQNVGIGVLCVLGALALYEFYDNVLAGPSYSTPEPARTAAGSSAAGDPTISTPGPETANRTAKAVARRNEEFNPKLHDKRPENRIDPKKIDPTLRLDLLAKVQAVEPSGGGRNLFQVGAPPKVETAALSGAEPIIRQPIGPPPPPPEVKPGPPAPPPPPPPIPLKFFGFTMVRSNGKKLAYFMDGDDILLASEGEMVKRRYRVVRINPTSVLMEDTESKRQQTLPLTEESQG